MVAATGSVWQSFELQMRSSPLVTTNSWRSEPASMVQGTLMRLFSANERTGFTPAA